MSSLATAKSKESILPVDLIQKCPRIPRLSSPSECVKKKKEKKALSTGLVYTNGISLNF